MDYFHKKFKKYTGMSPAEYRKNGFTPLKNLPETD
ncbi:AraC family transcriptional regulator [Eisenbergiella porci]|nr:AraC family transcriptional regulator [Eisenbergiella porci]